MLNLFCDGILGLIVGILAGTHLLVQILSPWDPFAANRRAEIEDGEEPDHDDEAAPWPGPQQSHRRRQPSWAAAWDGIPAHPGDAPTMAWPPLPLRRAGAAAVPTKGLRPVPLFMRWLWLAGLVAAVPTGISLLFAAFNGHVGRDESTIMTGFGVGGLLLAVLCLVKTCQGTFRNWWRYAFRWVLMWACVQTILLSAIILGSGNPSSDGQVACMFFIVMPAVLLPIMLFVRFSKSSEGVGAAATGPPRRRTAAPAVPCDRWK